MVGDRAAGPASTIALMPELIDVRDLGRVPYRDAYALQTRLVEEVLAGREAATLPLGTLLLLEHDPVITVSAREGAERHLLADASTLAREGVAVETTDRGGDITYHGPGQLVGYLIADLNRLNLGLHAYMRMLEGVVVDLCHGMGVRAGRDPRATGVWTLSEWGEPMAKLCAFGVRVRKWVSMHGLALNVTTNLDHFRLIVPCGLPRPVTSLENLLGLGCPSMEHAKAALAAEMCRAVEAADRRARAARAAAAPG